MNSWEIWFADGRVEQHSRRGQLSVEEMEAILDGYLDIQTILDDGEFCDMVVRWDALERMLPVNERATEGWHAALVARGLKSLRSEVIRGDVIVLGYPILRRAIRPRDRLAMELMLGELIEIDQDAQLAGYRAAVQNAISLYRAMLSETAKQDDAEAIQHDE